MARLAVLDRHRCNASSTLTLHVHFTRWCPTAFEPTADSSNALRFVPLPPPDDEDVFAIAVRIAGRVLP